MIFTVVNKEIHVGSVDVTGVASSSVFLIGDTNTIALSSIFDTPPESLIIGPFEPVAPLV
ncbi:spore gernimation protein GerPD [Bacillus carboniphilus]|uniref:Spore gernimation protein GerPD n=1 Tax=Bacillus carboniphilus TaxID=86663 RepID=A0ABY9JU21_9BACI|nr:spore gernimation protein GerPD [Bacillus carboniphilus]WLR42907.1 spore gernimation protein GerPD [Bacillus carboniphilus]